MSGDDFAGLLKRVAEGETLDAEQSARAFGANARHFADTPQLVAALHEAPSCAAALVKGSRFMGMERVVRALVPTGTADAH